MLDVSDEQVESFKKDVEDLQSIENKIKSIKQKIKPLQEELKQLNEIKTTKQEPVIGFMTENKLDVCNTANNDKIELKSTKSTRQITKGDIYDRILKYLNEEHDKIYKGKSKEEISRYLHDYIYVKDRQTVDKKVLKSG